MLDRPSDYEVECCFPDDMDANECDACIKIIRNGGAVDHRSAANELRRAAVVVIARKGDEIVGVGAIKRARPYAEKIAKRSGVPFQPDMKELGYVAVDDKHKKRGLSSCMVAALLSKQDGKLFATTDNAYMKRTLEKAGFLMKGKEWAGSRGRLSLWMRG